MRTWNKKNLMTAGQAASWTFKRSFQAAGDWMPVGPEGMEMQ